MIRVENAHHLTEKKDLPRYLVDKLWPKGIHRRALDLDGWVRAAAPSDALCRWFRQEPARFGEFSARYCRELERRPESWRSLAEAATKGDLVLIYGAKHPKFNNAQVLKEFLQGQIKAASFEPRRASLVKNASWPASPAPSKALSKKSARRTSPKPKTKKKEKRLRLVFSAR